MRLGASALTVALGAALAAGAWAGDAVDPQVGSGPPEPGVRDAQNEPAIAVDAGAVARGVLMPNRPLAVGANDYFDEAPCIGGTCNFVHGVGISGIYFSFNGGARWTKQGKLRYAGFSRTGDAMRAGRIATVPRFAQKVASHGDPALAFGPVPGAKFDWANGSRLYYATLAQRFTAPDKGPQVIAVSRTDKLSAAAASATGAWLPPVVVSSRTPAKIFADKPGLWADNAASSPHFGNVYVCWASYRSAAEAERSVIPPILFARSTDGGTRWSPPIPLSRAANGGQGCAIRTDSKGVVYVVWEGPSGSTGGSSIFMTKSADGGATFTAPRAVMPVSEVGKLDPALQAHYGLRLRVRTFDGVLGARTNSWPSIDIANGAPSGKNEHGESAPNTIVLAWADGRLGLDKEQALITYSKNRGKTWSKPADAAAATAPAPYTLERPDFPAVAISPNGTMLYVVYTAFRDPWQTTLGGPRRMGGVMRAVPFADFARRGQSAAWSKDVRGKVGDARGTASVSGEERSPRAGVAVEFIGDFNSVVATNDRGYAVWFDASKTKLCGPVSKLRANFKRSLRAHFKPLNIRQACPRRFGNGNLDGGVIVSKLKRQGR